MPIRARVTLFGLAVVVLVLGVISAAFLLLASGTAPRTQDEELRARAAAAVTAVQAAADLTPRAPLGAADLATGTVIAVVVLDDGGAALASDGVVAGVPPVVPADVLATAARDGSAAATVDAGAGVRLRAHVAPWSRPDGTGFVAAVQNADRVRSDRQGVVAVVVIAAIASGVAAAAGIWLVVGRALRPLRQLTAMADEIGRSADLGRRLPPVAARDDVGRLTASFNAMMARLQDAARRTTGALAAQQRFTADASHELRTPLTTVRSNAGFLRTHPDAAPADRAAALADIESESARMSRLVDDLLTLARSDGVTAGVAPPPPRVPVDVGALVDDVGRQARAAHPGRDIRTAVPPAAGTAPPGAGAGAAVPAGAATALPGAGAVPTGPAVPPDAATALPGAGAVPTGPAVQPDAATVPVPAGAAAPVGAPAVVLGDADALRRLVWVLVDNALTHAAGGVWVWVATRGAVVVAEVSDDGPGIAPELRERVFDRFTRVDSSRGRGGAGLGLSIAREIAAAHGGRVWATGNDRGGATLVVELPAASSRP